MPSKAPTSRAQSTATTDIEANAASFSRHLRAANKAPATIHVYLDAAARLDAFVASKGMPRAVGAIRREPVEAFIEDQLARLKPASAANRYRSLQQFFRWLVDEGEIRESPMARMKPPAIPETPPPVLRDEQLKKLLDTASGRTSMSAGTRRSSSSSSAPGSGETGTMRSQSSSARAGGPGGQRPVAAGETAT